MCRIVNAVASAAVLALVSGCASPIDRFLAEAESGNASIVENLDKCMKAEDAAETHKVRTLDDFLDCVFNVPIPQDRANLELRLLRGHAIVGVLAQYAAFSLKYSPLEQESGASTVLAKIETAETALWQASRFNTATNKPAHSELVEPVRHIDRVFAVSELAKAAATPAYNRAVGFFEKVVAAFSGSPVSGVALVKDVRDAIRRALIVNTYANAYVQGIGQFLANAQAAAAKSELTVEYWKSIDVGVINGACAKLGAMANVPAPHCVPPGRVN